MINSEFWRSYGILFFDSYYWFMLILAFSAAFVGLVHTLAPGHWLPVVLMAKAKRWPIRTAVLGAAVAAAGHVLLSASLGIVSIYVGVHFLSDYESTIERYAGLALAVFGLIYAGVAYSVHHRCKGHTHHGKNPKGAKAPFLFLFSLGFSPCIAILPVFVTAASLGTMSTLLAVAAFSLGVFIAMMGATLLVSLGVMKLDHPLFEHYGDVITGGGVAVMGVILFFVSQ